MKKIITLLAMFISGLAIFTQTTTLLAQTPAASSQHLKKNGTVDKRYKSSKAVTTSPQATPVPNPSSTGSTPSSSDMHMKAGGSDKSYKSSRAVATSPAAAPNTITPSASTPAHTTMASTASTTRHLKKDGTPDMRYKENKTPGVDKNGTPDKRYKANKQ